MITTLVFRETRFAALNPPVDTLATLRTEPGALLWVDLSQPTDEEIKQVLETTFAFHPLAIEDCVADSPFPKLEEYEDYLYLVMHAVVSTEQPALHHDRGGYLSRPQFSGHLPPTAPPPHPGRA
jgi:magnesium transporter